MCGLVRLSERLPVGFVDPRGFGQPGRLGSAVSEPRGVCVVGGRQGDRPVRTNSAGSAVMHRGRSVQPDAGVAVFVVVVAEERLAEHAGVGQRTEPVRKHRYFNVLNAASEWGLSLDTCGRECDRATPRSTSS